MYYAGGPPLAALPLAGGQVTKPRPVIGQDPSSNTSHCPYNTGVESATGTSCFVVLSAGWSSCNFGLGPLFFSRPSPKAGRELQIDRMMEGGREEDRTLSEKSLVTGP